MKTLKHFGRFCWLSLRRAAFCLLMIVGLFSGAFIVLWLALRLCEEVYELWKATE